MRFVSLIAMSSRTATVLLAPGGTRFRLPNPVAWTLVGSGGIELRAGMATTAALFLEALEPDTAYRLRTALGDIEFTTRSCAGSVDARDFGADPAKPDNASAIQAAIGAVPEGGTLLLSGGRFLSGPLFLRPDITFYLPEGAELAATHDWMDWPILEDLDEAGRIVGTWEGLPEKTFASLLTGVGCDGLTITGKGTVDGGGSRGDWWTWPKETRRGARRPRTVFLAHGNQVQLTGLTVRNSPSWTVHPYRCRHLLAAGLTIQNPSDSPNTDGLNPESCEDVALVGLHFSVGDDCIAVKAGKRAGANTSHLAPTRNLRISHCLMERGHGAVVLGSEMSGNITDVVIEHCEFSGTDRGLRIKTRRGRGGEVARISLTDVVMDEVATPLAVNAFYFCDPDGKSEAVQSRLPAPVDETTPRVDEIALTDVTATGVALAAVALLGLPEAPLGHIRISNMRVSFDPSAVAGEPLMACGVDPCRHAGIVAENAQVDGDLTILSEDLQHAD